MAKEIIIKIKIPEFKKFFEFVVPFFKNVFRRVLLDIKTKKKRGIMALILAGLFFWWFDISAGLLWFLFLMFLFYGWENRIIAVLALISLASCPVLLSLKKDAWAETMAVYAYFFLVMTVVLQIVEYKRHPELYNESENEEK